MESKSANRTLGLTLIAVLACGQSIAGVLRALHWFDVGGDLMGQGLLLMPLIGLVAFARGLLVGVLALSLLVFACGALRRWSWARWLGVVLAIVNLLLVLSILGQGEAPAQALLWSIVPLVMLGYLFSPAGRQALKTDSRSK